MKKWLIDHALPASQPVAERYNDLKRPYQCRRGGTTHGAPKTASLAFKQWTQTRLVALATWLSSRWLPTRVWNLKTASQGTRTLYHAARVTENA